MKTSINGGNPVPTAHLTVNKNRVKIYDNNYYLKNGQTFEVELYNPTNNKIKAEIHLDGENVSGGGLILRPGERIYLERFVDSNNKFLFETYNVEDSKEVKEAISNNGELRVRFYRATSDFNGYLHDSNIYNTTSGCFGGSFGGPTVIYRSNSTGGMEIIGGRTPLNANFDIASNGDGTWSNSTTNFMNVSNNVSEHTSFTTTSMDMSFEENTKDIETGRVEKGEASNQEFKTEQGSYEFTAFETVEYKILPVSNKPMTKDDVVQLKRYCHECGAKTKPKFKFCPSCGEKL